MEEEQEKFEIQFKAISELIGSPKEHIDKTLKLYLENLKKNEKFKFIEVKFYEAELQEKTGLYSAFAEMEMVAKNMTDLVGFCFDYMPSSIEVIKPEEFKIKSPMMSGIFNDLQDRLHKVEMHSKNMTAKEQVIKKQFLKVIRYVIHYHMEQDKSLTEEDISKITGIEKDTVIKYMDALVKRGELKKEDDKYVQTGKYKPWKK